MKKRILLIGTIFSVIIFLYIAKLFILQISPVSSNLFNSNHKYKTANWKKSAVHQRSKQLQLDDGRAVFLDEHHTPLHSETYSTIAFFPVAGWKHDSSEVIAALANVVGKSEDELSHWLLNLTEAEFVFDAANLPIRLSEEQLVELKGIIHEGYEIVQYTARKGHHASHRHVIGFIGEHPEWVELHYQTEITKLESWDRNMKVGVSGLERSLDKVIHGLGSTYISYTLDGQSRYLAGIGARVIDAGNPYYPLQVVTTIDEELQSAIEKLMDEYGIEEGAIVLLDAANGDIKAMVSRPALTPEQWDIVDENSWRNHALTAYEPGSIYKIITAAAALEYGVVDEEEVFHCDGEYGKYGLSCWKKHGHGSQTLAEAFANSCNIVFATLAERLTAEQINDTAAALGVVQQVGWHDDEKLAPFQSPIRLLQEEENGVSFLDIGNRDGGILAQTGIGQRNARLTPLQAANMLVTIVNGGKQFETRVVSSIQYADGIPVVDFPVHYGHEHHYQVHPKTAASLMKYMEKVITEGTGSHLSKGKWDIAGKTGTAQLSGKLSGFNNQWFVGFAPAQQPRYTGSVLIRKAKEGSKNKAPMLFQQMMELAAEHDANQ